MCRGPSSLLNSCELPELFLGPLGDADLHAHQVGAHVCGCACAHCSSTQAYQGEIACSRTTWYARSPRRMSV